MAFVIGSACIGRTDEWCMEECPVDCIQEGARKLYIQPNESITCGAWEAVCPVEATSPHRNVLPDEKEFIADNARLVLEFLPGRSAPQGSPGGAAKIGRVGVDTPLFQAAEGSA